MSDLIGNITVPVIAASGTFPLVTDYSHTKLVAPNVAIHQFISGNAKIEQRFLLGNGARRWTWVWRDLYEADLETLKDFWDLRRGPYQPFTLNVPTDDGTSTEAVTAVFEDAPLTWNRLVHLVSQVGITFVEIPNSPPTYSVADTVSRFPSGTLEDALESQVQEMIPLVKITPKEAGYPAIYLSDRRCTIGGQLYQARLLTWDGISQTLAGGPGDAAASQSDIADFVFGNADKVMRDLAADVDLFRASIQFSLFHVGSTIKLDLWKGEVVDYQSSSETEFALSAVDGLYDVTLQYPVDKISAKCGKTYDDGEGCPFSSTGGGHTANTLDLVNFPSADASFCDRGYLTDNGCKAHTMKRFFAGLVTSPQSVRIKDNSSGFFGFGRPTITATSLVADSVQGQPLREIYTDVAMPVECLIIAGRDEGDFYEGLGIVGAGPLQAYGRGSLDSAGNTMLHTLDGQPNHGYPGALGLREVLGSDPAGATDFLSLDQSGNQAGSDPDKAFSGSSTFADHFSAGIAFVVIRKSDEKGIQLTKLDQHSMEAIVSQGLQGWVWTESGVRSMQTLTNPVWLSINVFLRGTGLRFADAATAEEYFDLDAALAAAAICDLTVDKIVGSGTETQFKFQGIIKDLKVLRDWIQEVLNNALGCWVFSNGKLKITIREDAAAAASFSGGNIIMGSLQLGPVRPTFNRITVAFANSDYSFVADTIPITDEDHVAYLGRVLDSNMNLSGAAGKSMAGRIGAVRLKEELGGVGAAEWKAARSASWKTTVLALGVEPGMGVSIDDADVPGGTGLFRVLKWTLAPDYSIQLSGRTITDSMYDDVAGPKAVDVPPNPVPVEYFPYALKSAWCPNQEIPPVDDALFDEYDRTFGLQLTATERTDLTQMVRAIITGSLAVNSFIDDVQPPICRSIDSGTSTGNLLGGRKYWAQVFARAVDGRWSPGSNVRHFNFEDVATDANWIEVAGLEWPEGDWDTFVLFVGDDEKTICAQVETFANLTGGNARHFAGGDQASLHDQLNWGNHSEFMITGDLTFGMWIRFSGSDPPSVDQWIMAQGTTNSIGVDNMLYGLRVEGTAGAWNIGYRHRYGTFTPEQVNTFATNIPDNTWVFIVLRRGPGHLAELLVSYDGLSLHSKGTFTGWTPPDGGTGGVPRLMIGNAVHGDGVVADIDSHYLFARVLTDKEVLKLARGKLSTVDPTALVLACDLGDTTEVDLSSYNHSNILNGTTIIGDGIGPSNDAPLDFIFPGPLRESTYNAPNPAHKLVRVKVKPALHAGTIGAVVTDIDSGTGAVTFGGLAGTTDDWTGRKLYWAADFSDGIAAPIHFNIDTYDPVTGVATLTPDPVVSGLSTQDVVYFRLEPNIFSTDMTEIGDVMIVNDIYPTGAVVDGEIGHIIRGVTPGRPHQIRRIISNLSDRYRVDKAFEYAPTFFTVELANWEYFAESSPVDVPNTDVKTAIATVIDNLSNQPIVVGVFLVDRYNNETPEDFAVIRDSYVYGADAASILTSKGDLLAHGTTGETALPVGTDNQVLVSDSAAATGLSWVDPTVADSKVTFTDITTGNVTSAKHGFAPKSPADATKFLNGAATPAFAAVKDSDLSTTDVTTNNVTSAKHGFTPKSPADATKFLNGAATPAFAAVKDSDLSTTDITTNDVSTSKHGFAPKLPNDGTKYLDGTGLYSLPAGSSGGMAAKTADYTAVGGDTGKLLSFNKATAVQLTLPAAPPSSTWYISVQNIGAGLLTISRNSLTIDGASANLTLPTGTGLLIYTDGSNYFTSRGVAALDSQVSFSDITTGNVSTSAHGFAPKLPNDATKYLDGTGLYSIPAGGGGGSGAMVSLATSTLAVAAASVTFSALSGSYKTLIIEIIARGSQATNFVAVNLQFNTDTGNNYDYNQAFVSGGSGGNQQALASAQIFIGNMPGSTATANNAASFSISIPGYAQTTFNKALSGTSNYNNQGAALQAFLTGGQWRNTAAITEVKIIAGAGNFVAGSQFTVYGLT